MLTGIYDGNDTTFHYAENSLRNCDMRNVISACFIDYEALSDIEMHLCDDKWYDILIVDIDIETGKTLDRIQSLKGKGFFNLLFLCSYYEVNSALCNEIGAEGFILHDFSQKEVFDVFYRAFGQIRSHSYIIKGRKNTIFIPYAEIRYFEATRSRCVLHTSDDKQYSVHKTLSQIEDEIQDLRFFRSNRDFIVNINCIEKTEEGIRLDNGTLIPMKQSDSNMLEHYLLRHSAKRQASLSE